MRLSSLNWRHARLICVGLLCLGLSACFDFEQDLTLKGSGAGVLEVILRTDPFYKGALANETLLGEQKAPVVVKRDVINGQYVQDERVTFNALSDLETPDETLSVISNGTTFFGIGPKDLTLLRTLDNSGADENSLGSMRSLFNDRTYTFKVTLPGWINKAYPLVIGDQSIEPQVDGATVTWQISMAQALSAPQLAYRVDFYSFMDVKGNLTADRVHRHVGNLGNLGLSIAP